MQYISIDLETTGLDPHNCQILEIGAILEDTDENLAFEQCPKFHCYVIPDEKITGDAIALSMNQNIIKLLSKREMSDDKQKFDIENKMLHRSRASQLFDVWLQQVSNLHNCVLHGDRNAFNQTLVQNIFCVDSLLGYATHEHKHESIINLKYPNKPVKVNVAGKNFSGFDKPFIDVHLNLETKFSQRVIDPAILFWNPEEDTRLPNLDECLKRAGIAKTVTHNALEDAWDIIEVMRTVY